MPDVIIKGMEMPESCPKCQLADVAVKCPLTGKSYNWGMVTRASDYPLRPAPEWISVDYDNPESLPSKSKSVLYCAFGRSVGEGYYIGFDGYHHVWKMYSCCGTHWDDEVTHWMQLPEPPKEETT